MSLLKLDVFNVRNIQNASIKPSGKINFIYGKNASGKSSLLEAIFILGLAKSFRTSSIKNVVNFNKNFLTVSGQVQHQNKSVRQIGIEFKNKSINIRIDQLVKSSRSSLAYVLPLQLIHPKSFQLLDAGSQLRREFLDWGVFNNHQAFLLNWRKYKKALIQRNILLKKHQIKQINIWNQELFRYGTIVADYRNQYLQQLENYFQDVCCLFFGVDTMELSIYSGWQEKNSLLQSLNESLDNDLRYGFTSNGPHRADFKLIINNRLAKDYVSRGQLKLLVLALKLAQVKMLDDFQNKVTCVLIDDFTAELDSKNKSILLEYLSQLGIQVFMTATEMSNFGVINNIKDYKMFHVEHGKVNQV